MGRVARQLRGGETGGNLGRREGNTEKRWTGRGDRTSLDINCREAGRGAKIAIGGNLEGSERQEGSDRLEWGQEGGAVLGRLDQRKMGKELTPRCEQAPPCHRTLGSSGWKGNLSTLLFVCQSSTLSAFIVQRGERGALVPCQLLHPCSPILSAKLIQAWSFISAM